MNALEKLVLKQWNSACKVPAESSEDLPFTECYLSSLSETEVTVLYNRLANSRHSMRTKAQLDELLEGETNHPDYMEMLYNYRELFSREGLVAADRKKSRIAYGLPDISECCKTEVKEAPALTLQDLLNAKALWSTNLGKQLPDITQWSASKTDFFGNRMLLQVRGDEMWVSEMNKFLETVCEISELAFSNLRTNGTVVQVGGTVKLLQLQIFGDRCQRGEYLTFYVLERYIAARVPDRVKADVLQKNLDVLEKYVVDHPDKGFIIPDDLQPRYDK